jgi:uncharacterized protein with von Willebrand factor type A (vWA) domain
MTVDEHRFDELSSLLDRLDARHGALGANLVQFSALLKAGEVDVTTGQLLTAGRALLTIDVSQRNDVHVALAASLLTANDQRPTFDALFDMFWRLVAQNESMPPARPERVRDGQRRPGQVELMRFAATRGGTGAGSTPETPPRSYSDDDALIEKDFATYRDDDVQAARRYLRRLAPKLATATVRRQRRARSGRNIDMRRSLIVAARRGGEVLHLAYRRRKVRRINVVLCCDVSGSMDVYSRFLVQFLYSFQSELRGVSTFVFSTRLSDVTPMLRARSLDQALEHVANQVDSWSGGTRIGACLGEFNRRYAKARLGPRTVVVIISDGWDRGDIDQLSREMRALRRRAYRIVWLNPLLGSQTYQPLALGMAAALPLVDEFLPVHNLASLARVGRKLIGLSRR